ERIQGDIFDYLITVMPEFGLSLYQQPSGADMRVGLGGQSDRGGPAQTAETFPTERQG
ncbi:mechanosensitive ion channel family protein, partial [Pseudomonas syringae]|nr:mechanosensitive ion channel family protein [Pseudomonas syringae]